MKNFEFKILMSLKPLIQNYKTFQVIIDILINLKIKRQSNQYRMINNLHTNMKKDHRRITNDLYINMKKERYSIIRRYQHVNHRCEKS